MFFCFFLFFYCLFLVALFHTHYLLLLLFLEVFLLGVFCFLCFGFLSSHGLPGLFVFLLLMVCMGGFSISILVSVSRFFGRDFWYFRFVF